MSWMLRYTIGEQLGKEDADMTRKDFQEFANEIQLQLDRAPEAREYLREVAITFAEIARRKNSRFQYKKFMDACGF